MFTLAPSAAFTSCICSVSLRRWLQPQLPPRLFSHSLCHAQPQAALTGVCSSSSSVLASSPRVPAAGRRACGPGCPPFTPSGCEGEEYLRNNNHKDIHTAAHLPRPPCDRSTLVKWIDADERRPPRRSAEHTEPHRAAGRAASEPLGESSCAPGCPHAHLCLAAFRCQPSRAAPCCARGPLAQRAVRVVGRQNATTSSS